MDEKKLARPSPTRTWLWRWTGLLLIAVLLVSGSLVGAREPEPKVMTIPAADKLVVEEEVRMPAEFNPKLDSALNQLLEAQRTEGMAGARAFGEGRQMVLEGDRVQVILVTEPAAIPGLAPAVEGQGGEIQGDYEGLLQALVPIDALEPLAGRPDVHLIRDPWRAIELEAPGVGSATTEGVVASNAAAWHSAGHDGTGVRVAVINGGFNDYSTLLGSDLPGSVGTYDWTSSGMGGSDHGTACAEIVHDMAPGATMDLHKISTVVDLGQAVTQAIADGVDVISMSMGWSLDGPGDGTGTLANMVNTARANGIFWATAAGNDAEVNWAGTYLDSGTSSYHAWDGGSTWYNFMGEGTSCVVFPAGYPIRGSLHWDDWSAVNQDYDLHLYRWPLEGPTIYRVASSEDPQNGGGGQTPLEYISYSAAGGNCYAWVVERVSSTRNVCLRMIAPKTSHFVHWTVGRSLTYPADSPDAITVAAVDVNSPYPLESYSSQGPTFGPGGSCSGGAIKPDIASYANVSTVSYGPGAFNGTSAATPHVAGAAALAKQRYPGYSVTQLQNYLENEALDLGTAGKDNVYGSGRLYLPLPGPVGPVVTSITPNSGPNTGTVQITNLAGSNFQSGATVKLTKSGQTDINATSVVVNSSQITCDFDLTGAATGMWNVVVTNPDTQSGTLPNGFTVTGSAAPPTVTSITPNSGQNTGVVGTVLLGSNFESGATVKLTKSGQTDINATGVTWVSSSVIMCDFDLTGAATGMWNVVVTNPDMQSGTLPNGFTVTGSATAPTVTSITPNSGENTGVVSTVLLGSNFESGATVKLTKSGQTDINATGVTWVSSSVLTCDFDLTGAATGAWNVVATNPDTQSGTLTNGFTVTSPDEDYYTYLPLVLRRSPPIPYPPTLNPISNSDGDGNYTVSWSTAQLATTYELQEDDNPALSSPTVVYSGSGTSKSITGRALGTYYYRARGCNSYGCGSWSQTQSVVVAPPASGPNPGFWEGPWMEFYVTSDRANVDNFAIYISVSGCGNYKITHTPLEPIVNNHFSFSGSFYGNGTFTSSTSCSGTAGLSHFLIPGCGYVSGGPSSYSAGWQGTAPATTDAGAVSVVVEKVDEGTSQPFLTAEMDLDRPIIHRDLESK